MGQFARVIEDHPNFQILETGGFIGYSEEFLMYCSCLSEEQRHIAESELLERARRRRLVKYKPTIALPEFINGTVGNLST